MVTKEEILQKHVAKDVLKNKMITVAGQMFFEYEKELDNSNQIIKGYEDCIGDKKVKKDILDKVCGAEVEEYCSAKDVAHKNISINSFFKVLTK